MFLKILILDDTSAEKFWKSKRKYSQKNNMIIMKKIS